MQGNCMEGNVALIIETFDSQGDSGGALTVNSIAIGITSWGDECAAENSPGVYTDVLSVVNWIRNKAMIDE